MIAVIVVRIPDDVVKHIDRTFPTESASQLRQVAYDYIYAKDFFLATDSAVVKVYDGVDNSIEITLKPQGGKYASDD